MAAASGAGAGVIVAGAGPVGLVAAAALADAGVPVSILEQSEALPEDLRASTFHPPTLDMLERFSVTGRMIEDGLICRHWQFRDRRTGVVATFDLGLLAGETRHPFRLQCEQWRLSRLLRERLSANPLVSFDFEAKVTGVAQDDSGVTVSVERPDGRSELRRGAYLIGSDGLRSAVRQAVGVAFEGMTIPELFLTMSTTFPFHEAMEDLANIAYISDPAEWVVLLRTRSLWRVLVPVNADLSDAEVTDPAACQARLQGILANPAGYEIRHRTAYRVHERVAETYVKGRVFLAGDAAHVNNPLGGMGLNGGIHDAVNLADKLALVWHGEAPLGLMERYGRQRRKVALDVVQAQTLRNRAILNATDPKVRADYQDELRRTVEDEARHKAYVLRSSMIQSLRDLEQVA
jgi:3-(3-hydroxy-phenyl)propionate hydroxylase